MKDQEATQILTEVVNSTQNDINVFFVIVTVILIGFLIPTLAMLLADRRERRKAEHANSAVSLQAENERLDRHIQREAQIMQVIKENSEVIASLKVTLENNGISTNRSLDRIHERIDGIYKETDKMNTKLALIHNLLDNGSVVNKSDTGQGAQI